jgi:hypothetical protein
MPLDQHLQHGHAVPGKPVLSIGTGLDEEKLRLAREPIYLRTAEALLRFYFTPYRSDAALPAVGGGSASIPTVRLAKRPIFDGRAAPLFELNERTVVLQDRGALGSDHLHAHQHGDSQWKGLSEIAATSREHSPEKFGGLA